MSRALSPRQDLGVLKNKRGIFFTTLALFMIFLLLTSYTFSTAATQRKAVHDRVTTMNSFVFSTEQDLARSAYIAGFRALFVAEKKIAETGAYIAAFNASINELFSNGTFNGEAQDIMVGATAADIEQSLKDKAAKMNINLTLLNPQLVLIHENPWQVTALLTTQLLVIDSTNVARWNRTVTAKTFIDIQNFNDPLYTVATQAHVTNRINRTAFQPFVTSADVSNLSKHALDSYYTNSTEAPSFIDRLQGLSSSSPQGIESLVNLQKLTLQGISVQNKSVVDHLYFSSQNPSSSTIQGMPSWFRLDETHSNIYGTQALDGF